MAEEDEIAPDATREQKEHAAADQEILERRDRNAEQLLAAARGGCAFGFAFGVF